MQTSQNGLRSHAVIWGNLVAVRRMVWNWGEVRQGKEEDFRPEVYVVARPEVWAAVPPVVKRL